jgi:hypothetical protein
VQGCSQRIDVRTCRPVADTCWPWVLPYIAQQHKYNKNTAGCQQQYCTCQVLKLVPTTHRQDAPGYSPAGCQSLCTLTRTRETRHVLPLRHSMRHIGCSRTLRGWWVGASCTKYLGIVSDANYTFDRAHGTLGNWWVDGYRSHTPMVTQSLSTLLTAMPTLGVFQTVAWGRNTGHIPDKSAQLIQSLGTLLKNNITQVHV